MARVFVGIPTRNRSLLVREAVSSVLRQSCGDFRVVVSDNASLPECFRDVERFVSELRDDRVTYHRQPKNVGEYGQGHFLFGACREEFFAILHDDDLMAPSYLETAIRRFDENPDVDCFVANPRIIDEEGTASDDRARAYDRKHGRDRRSQGKVPVLESLLESGFIPISGTVFRSRALAASGFVDEDCFGCFPFEFNLLLRLGERGAAAWFEPERLVAFREHQKSMRETTTPWADRHIVGTMILLLERRKFEGRKEKLRRRLLSFMHNFQARIHLRDGDVAASRRSAATALKTNPLCRRALAVATLSWVSPKLLRSLLGDRWKSDAKF